mmetsp:Transcript_16884/g.59029  ORF Transcript_16884/g.59029 Transcript_16884/m.59029 type:complete len:139 (-) Transcript_16884:228-644(-)
MAHSVGRESFYTEGGASMNTIATGGGVVGIDLARGLGPGRRGGRQHYWRVSSALTAADGGEDDNTPTWGYLLLAATLAFFVVTLYAVLVAPLMPRTGNVVLDFFSSHPRYALQLPLLLPTTFVAVLINWMAMKFFRHN